MACLEGKFSSRSASTEQFDRYIVARGALLGVLQPHYEAFHHRRLRFKAHIERQRFEGRFVRDIKRTFAPGGEQIVIAWGMWGKRAGRPGTVGNRGRPPTLGVGLARRVAREDGIVVAWTPEYYTTKTCFECGGLVGRSASAEWSRALDAGFRHRNKEIRGLRVCNNLLCRKHLNRDLNAAKNIAANGLLMLQGKRPIRCMDSTELEINELLQD